MKLYFLLVLILCGCSTHKVKPSFTADLSGKWASSTAEEPCTKKWHRIYIDEKQRAIIFEDAEVFEQYTGENTRFYKYNILEKVENGYHLSLESDKRVDEEGNIISWYILQSDNSTYAWRRSDWRADGRTKPVFRCKS